ncbi:hypothetical protein Gotur_015245 [Gossypium turneri]
MHWRWLQQLFGYHGRVMDVFIPKKRGAAGRRFGFVRYGNIRDGRRGIERLDDFMMMNQRLGGNMVQFQGRKTHEGDNDGKDKDDEQSVKRETTPWGY